MKEKPLEAGAGLVWERPEPPGRTAPGPLSRDGIVRAAMAIADAEGLVSVSLRKVAAALDAGPMRLYGYVATKEELLDLMVDAVYGEMVSAGPIRGEWREALRSTAHRIRGAAGAHKWFIELVAVGRPNMGPHTLAFLEASLAALSDAPGFKDIDTILHAVRTVSVYAIGAIQSEARDLRVERESGMDEAQWQESFWPYLQRVIATGRFPMIARVVRDAIHPKPEAMFDQGLDCVLDGIAARLSR
ncbi:TetR/AcrR family transcriptional regulator [Hyalangium versicolor]|uniref:TetR/AcrR family transcriptional regulator n=1 Tax=Hyalangium versicolor TaxID=2861190 RepID=UPI001CCC3B02|nr:TetR/AcrR family transcriptional regulator C-terminal domain-containing protein [Hyalangium versicolor]